MSINKKIIGLDLETSGLSPDDDQILSATFLVMDEESGQELDRMRVRIGYRGDIVPSPEAVYVNGISVFKHGGVSEAAAVRKIHKFLSQYGGSDAVFLGHNVSFDLKHLKNLFARSGYDPKNISFKKVDTYVEAGRAICHGRLKVDRLDEVVGKDGKTRRTLKQESLARALNIEVDQSRLHDDLYDVEINTKIWNALGRPKYEERGLANDPHEIQSTLAGKTITTKEWDYVNSQIVAKKYFVVGKGTSEGETVYGYTKSHGTCLVRLETDDFEKALKIHHEFKNDTNNEKLLKSYFSALEKISVEKKYSSSEWFSVESQPTSNSLSELMTEISPNIIEIIQTKRMKNLAKQFERHESLVQGLDLNLLDPENKQNVVNFSDHNLISELSYSLSLLSKNERSAKVSNLANSQSLPRGKVWAAMMLKLSEDYGIRNRLPGYESNRIINLKKNIPQQGYTVVLSKSLEEVENVVSKAMIQKGIQKIDMICNGKEVRIKAFAQNGLELSRRKLEIILKENGTVSFPLASDIAEVLADQVGLSASAANSLRTGFSAFADHSSYQAVKENYRRLLAKAKLENKDEAKISALEDTLGYLGDSYDEFINRPLIPLENSDEGLNAYDLLMKKLPEQKSRLTNSEITILADEVKERREDNVDKIIEQYEGVKPIVLNGEEDSLTILAINLRNPTVKIIKELDHLVINEGLSLCTLPDDDASEAAAEGEDEIVGIRCKVCNRLFNSRNAVAGMGPTCAKKLLEEWLPSPELGVAEISTGRLRRLTDFKEENGYPIMLVRDVSTGKTFATDIKVKDKDGRYLVVDLSGVIKKSSAHEGLASLFKETLKVYLDDENYEIVKVFGSKK